MFKKGKKKIAKTQTIGVHLVKLLGVNLTKEEYEAAGGRANKEFVFEVDRQCDAKFDGEMYQVHPYKEKMFKEWYKLEHGEEIDPEAYEIVDNLKAKTTQAIIAYSIGDEVSTIRGSWVKEEGVLDLMKATSKYTMMEPGAKTMMGIKGFSKVIVDGKIKFKNKKSTPDNDEPMFVYEPFGAETYKYEPIIDTENRNHRKGNTLGFVDFLALIKSLLASTQLKTAEDMLFLDKKADIIELLGGRDALAEGDFDRVNDIIRFCNEEYDDTVSSVYGIKGKVYNWQDGKGFIVLAPLFRGVTFDTAGNLSIPDFDANSILWNLTNRGIAVPATLPLKPVELTIEIATNLDQAYGKYKAELKARFASFSNSNSNGASAESSNSGEAQNIPETGGDDAPF